MSTLASVYLAKSIAILALGIFALWGLISIMLYAYCEIEIKKKQREKTFMFIWIPVSIACAGITIAAAIIMTFITQGH